MKRANPRRSSLSSDAAQNSSPRSQSRRNGNLPRNGIRVRRRQRAFDQRAAIRPTSIINEVRGHVDAWRSLPKPNQWQVTPETARLLQHWRQDKFSSVRPFFCHRLRRWKLRSGSRRSRHNLRTGSVCLIISRRRTGALLAQPCKRRSRLHNRNPAQTREKIAERGFRDLSPLRRGRFHTVCLNFGQTSKALWFSLIE
jgi:hypothetical protein